MTLPPLQLLTPFRGPFLFPPNTCEIRRWAREGTRVLVDRVGWARVRPYYLLSRGTAFLCQGRTQSKRTCGFPPHESFPMIPQRASRSHSFLWHTSWRTDVASTTGHGPSTYHHRTPSDFSFQQWHPRPQCHRRCRRNWTPAFATAALAAADDGLGSHTRVILTPASGLKTRRLYCLNASSIRCTLTPAGNLLSSAISCWIPSFFWNVANNYLTMYFQSFTQNFVHCNMMTLLCTIIIKF